MSDVVIKCLLQHLQAYKSGNVFEVNLPNKVTKIMAVPQGGTVRDAVRPVVTKYGYNVDIMELRFAKNFEVQDILGREYNELARLISSSFLCTIHLYIYNYSYYNVCPNNKRW